MGVKLTEPLTGGTVEAYDEAAAQKLIERGFKRIEKPKRTRKRQTKTKEQ